MIKISLIQAVYFKDLFNMVRPDENYL